MLVSGTAPIWPDGAVDADPYAQAMRCFEIIAAALAEAGASLDGEAMAGARPAATMVVVKALLDERWKVEIEAEALIS